MKRYSNSIVLCPNQKYPAFALSEVSPRFLPFSLQIAYLSVPNQTVRDGRRTGTTVVEFIGWYVGTVNVGDWRHVERIWFLNTYRKLKTKFFTGNDILMDRHLHGRERREKSSGKHYCNLKLWAKPTERSRLVMNPIKGSRRSDAIKDREAGGSVEE